MYNFEVAGTHTYFVGDSAVWVHNSDKGLGGGVIYRHFNHADGVRGISACRPPRQASRSVEELSVTETCAVVEQVRSGDLEAVVAAMDAANHLLVEYLEAVVERFRREPGRAFLAERLVVLGTAVVPFVEPLLKSQESEVAVMAALTLLHVGERSGVSVLIRALAAHSE